VWSLPRFEGHSATETVRRIIREAIVDGRIPPGEQLRESRLVEMLGISRGTVREAVRQLVQEGLVEYRMHYGAFVKAQLLEDRLDVYVARRTRGGPTPRTTSNWSTRCAAATRTRQSSSPNIYVFRRGSSPGTARTTEEKDPRSPTESFWGNAVNTSRRRKSMADTPIERPGDLSTSSLTRRRLLSNGGGLAGARMIARQ